MSGYTPGLVWKKYSFIHTILHQKKKSFLSRLQWLCSYTGSHLCKPWKLHFFPLYGLNSPSAFDGRAIVDTFLFSIPERQKLPTLLIESEQILQIIKLDTNALHISLCLFSETHILMNWTFVAQTSSRNCNSVLMKHWYFSLLVNFFRDFCLIWLLLNWNIFLVGDVSCLHS